MDIDFSHRERQWREEVDARTVLADVLNRNDIEAKLAGEWIELKDGLIARPQFVEVQLRDDGSVRTATTVEVNHQEICPDGVFEFQHSIGDTVEASLRDGFDNWMRVDLPVFMDALRSGKRELTYLTMEYPDASPLGKLKREVILGPTAHLVQHKRDDIEEEHCFCPCCLFTNSMDAFREQLDSTEFYGNRLYALRNADGEPESDCRVNGIEWEPGKEALRKYVATWPDRGFEYRKQFVAIRTANS